MSKTTVLYKDIAPGAEEDASVTASSAVTGSDPAALPLGVTAPRAYTLERNRWLLDGTYKDPDGAALGFWSEQISGDDCAFTVQPSVVVAFDEQYSSTGITLVFDEMGGEYPYKIHIAWKQGSTVKAEKDFYPTSTQHFCQQRAESYDSIVITFVKTWLPRQRARLNRIVFGVRRTFGMTDLRAASIVQESSLLSLEVPVSAFSWTLNDRNGVDYLFQFKQPLEVRNGETLLGVYYIDGAKRRSKGVYDLECYDAFGVLDEMTFPGGVYSGVSAKALLSTVIGGTFDVEYADGVADTTLTGAILPGTRREAIQQILFAWGVAAATDGTEKIRIYTPGAEAISIGASRTYTGASTETAALVTKVIVSAHTYTQSANGGVEIGGVKYEDTVTEYTVSNPDVTATDKQRIISIDSATLVSPSIGQATAQRVYDYYMKRNKTSAKIVWQGEKLGDMVTVPNNWGGTNTGNLTRMEITLSNKVAAACEMIGG